MGVNLVQTRVEWVHFVQDELEGLKKEGKHAGGHVCQLQNHVRDLQADCKDGQALASLQALLVAFEDKPIDEADPTSADNFGEKWRRRLGSLLQCPKVVPVKSQQETKGENAAVQAEGCPVWVQELMKELEVDCPAQPHRRAARQAQVEEGLWRKPCLHQHGRDCAMDRQRRHRRPLLGGLLRVTIMNLE